MNASDLIQTKPAREYVQLIKQGVLTSESLVRHCLDVIKQTDEKIGAWAHVDREHVLDQARTLDEIRRRGQPTGVLHGIPVGIKDIIDTVDFPTEMGSVVFAGHQPESDAAIVEKLKEAGAVILGKTVCTEFAYMHASATKNPCDLRYSPGGSSSGSAAAVAAGQVPLAIGSQTNGSTIRPASYCGIYGYKPTRGIVSRRGVLTTSSHLDQIGVFGLHPSDLALLGDAIGGYDAADSMSYLKPRPRTLEGFDSDPLVEPVFAWFDLPYADRYSSSLREGSLELLAALGKQVDRVPAPQSFAGLIESLRVIYSYELSQNLQSMRETHESMLSSTMRNALESADKITSQQYADALDVISASEKWFSQLFNDYDAILTPSALGEAPLFEQGTGDPICCTIWTLTGLPCISLPLLEGMDDMPIGIQLVGGTNEDDRLFRTTRWVLNALQGK